MSHGSESRLREAGAVEVGKSRRNPGPWPDWTKEEDQVIDRFAIQMKNRCRFFQGLLDSAVAELGQFYRRHPECRPGGRDRTRYGVRGRLYARACALGRGEVAARWVPEERRLSEKWAWKLQFGIGRLGRLCLKDCARMLLAELYERGYDRSLRSCSIEIRKQRQRLFGRP